MSHAWQCTACVPHELPEARWSPGPLKELDGGSIVELFNELHARLAVKQARASLYVVGGSALLLAHRRDLMTPDVDIARSVAVADEAAREIAVERGLPMNWLNSGAAPWVPPAPECTARPPVNVGLTIHLAPARHLLAMKLVAWRSKDEDDLIDLIYACGLASASAEEVADVLYDVYSGEDSLPGLLGIPRSEPEATRREAVARSQDALALLGPDQADPQGT